MVIAHQGRPGRKDFTSLKEHAKLLNKLTKIKFVNDIIEKKAVKEIKKLKFGEALLIENIRTLDEEFKPGKNKFEVYVKTEKALTRHSDKNWMMLLIDTDKSSQTGWYGYDVIINKKVIDKTTTMLQKYNKKTSEWIDSGIIIYRYSGNEMEIRIPRWKLGLNKKYFTIDFHWVDNPKELKNPISLCTDGDSAPNRRFNYRCIWEIN